MFVRDKRIKNKCFRQRWRNYKIRVATTARIQKLKWAVSYSVWDGEELLEESIRSIRGVADYVQVVWQKVSWRGTPASTLLEPLLKRLKEDRLIDELVEFQPDINDKPWHNELKKRNLGLALLKKRGVDYFMTMDADEFYEADQLQEVKYTILKENLTHVYSPITTYLAPTKQLIEPSCFVNIWSRIHFFSRLGHNRHAPCLCDPTREVLHFPFAKYWVQDKMAMHHFSKLRKNVMAKWRESSAFNARKTFVCEATYSVVPDRFNLTPIVERWDDETA
ncbi:MAG: hypothetical protein ILP11_01050 [Alphaproteobacteria bacterium]|nr:hypothetical protein [Alphaproteobacteria bacterium]